ncbi:MAG: hypothetical protein HKM89_10780 [Gemmatimonadales bacterium]|nr:hypothetical protein [Gemmatimonadales bacterium]
MRTTLLLVTALLFFGGCDGNSTMPEADKDTRPQLGGDADLVALDGVAAFPDPEFDSYVHIPPDPDDPPLATEGDGETNNGRIEETTWGDIKDQFRDDG